MGGASVAQEGTQAAGAVATATAYCSPSCTFLRRSGWEGGDCSFTWAESEGPFHRMRRVKLWALTRRSYKAELTDSIHISSFSDEFMEYHAS